MMKWLKEVLRTWLIGYELSVLEARIHDAKVSHSQKQQFLMDTIRQAYHCQTIEQARPILSIAYEKHRSRGVLERDTFISFMADGDPHITDKPVEVK